MVREIYTRTPDDPNYEGELLEFSDEIESILTQMRTLLGTNKGDVFGVHTFGIDLENAVFSTRKSAEQIIQELNSQINDYVYSGTHKTTANINFGHSAEGYDYAVVDIVIDGVKTLGVLVDKD